MANPEREARVSNSSEQRSALPFVAAFVPVALAILCDPEARAFDGDGRSVVLGLSLGGDRSLTAPLGQLLAPIAALLPLGHAELRAAIALSLPAAIATYLVALRISRVSFAVSTRTSFAIVLAFGMLAGALLGAAPPEASIVAIALELLLLRDVPGLAIGVSALALWCAPRLAPACLVVAALSLRTRRTRNGLLAVVMLLVPLIVLLVARDGSAWLVVGTRLHATSKAPPLDGAALRAGITTLVLAAAARLLARDPSPQDRASMWGAAVAIACGSLLSAPGALAVAATIAAPLAATSAGAIAILVDKKFTSRGSAGGGPRKLDRQRMLALSVQALVPALCLGLAARAIEVDLGARRLGPAAAAHDVSALLTTGTAPPRAVLLIEDEAALLAFARERVVHGFRPDVQVLPAQSLLAGGAARMATRTLESTPGANETLRALLAHGQVDVADLAPLAQRVPVASALPAARVKLVARHAASTGGPLLFALERVDPSDRRLRRAAIERRLAALSSALGGRPETDRVRRALRVDATREARILSIALDRDGVLAAIARMRALGAREDLTVRWLARTQAKQTLENEPLGDDD